MDRMTDPVYGIISYTLARDWMESAKDGKLGRRDGFPISLKTLAIWHETESRAKCETDSKREN